MSPGMAGAGTGAGRMAGALERWIRYAALATLVVLGAVGAGWLPASPEGRRGLLVAGGIALPLQLGAFAILVVQRTGSPGFLAAWVGSTLVRFGVVAGAAFWVAGMEGVDTLVALLTLVGLLFVLLLLEPWMLRPGASSRCNGD